MIEQKLMVLANDYNEISSAPLKKRLATAKEIGFSPKNHLKHFRKASFKNPSMIRNHSRVVSEQQKDKDKDIEESSKLCENSCFSEDNNEKNLLLQVQRILIAVRVAISPLNSKFFMNNMLFAKYETKISRILGPDVSEKLRYEALRWVYQEHPADKASVHVYLSWKLKKWNAEFRREQVLKQKKKLDLQEFVICKICDQKVPEMNLLSHSGFCKKLEDLKEKTKQNVQNLSNKFQTGFADERRKENIKGTIIKNRIQRLNVKIRRIKQINRMDFENENDEEIEQFAKKSNFEQISLSDEECVPNFSIDTPQDLIKLHLIPKEEAKISEFKEESDGQSDTPASMTISIDFTSKLNRMRLMKNKNEVFISKEDISVENTPAEKMRRSCFDLGEKFKKESPEGEMKIRAMLQEEGEKLKINKKIIKYIDQFLDLINVYITMSPEAPSSAFLKLQQYFLNNSMVLGSMRTWIRKKDPIKVYEDVWSKCDEALEILKAQNECYTQILEAEKELKLLALPPKPKLRKEPARTFSINVQKHKNSEDAFLTCKPPRAIEHKPHFSLGGTKHLTIRRTEKESKQLIIENNMKIDFSSIFKTPQEENKEVKEVRFSYQKPIILEKRDSATGTSKFSKNIFSFEEIEKKENEVKVVRKLKKTITSIESPPKMQERMSFLRRVSNVGLNGINRSKTHLFYNEPSNNRLTIPSYNIIENFVHDKTISFPSKKKAIKQFLDTPICLGGNYIESYNSDGVLMTLKKKRAERKKSLSKINNAENRDDTEESATEEDGDLSFCYMSDQMEKNHINDCKMNENKLIFLIFSIFS